MAIREIVFRGKRKDNGEWVYGYYEKYNGDSYINLQTDRLNSGGYPIREFIEVIPESISEFTGLTDKNGKKIFEGDILNCVTSDFDGSDKFVYNFKVTDITDFETMGFLNFCNELEVIGNIHDNPELVKGGAE